MKPRNDVRFAPLAGLSWEDDQKCASLERVFNHAVEHASTVIDWYLAAKQSKKICAQGLRLGAIALSTLGGLFPVIADTIGVSAVWATVLLGLAGMCVAIDRFFGCSSAWMRFITAEHNIRQRLNEFQISREQLRASWHSAPPNDEDVQHALALAKSLIVDVETIVLAETAQWRSEFQTAIKEIESNLKHVASKQ